MRFRIVIFIFLTTFVVAGHAEIYRWQDENGRWHFSDAPKGKASQPRSVRSPSNSEQPEKTGESPDTLNLSDKLQQRFNPNSNIERVTLAVVGIETALGQGSGFFVSDNGYLITNRHVIRPDSTNAWKRDEESFAELERKLKDYEEKLDRERDSIAEYKEKLDAYREDVERRSDSAATSAAKAEYADFAERFEERVERYEQQRREHEKRNREFEQEVSSFRLKSSMAGAARQFKVFMKDNSEIRARLVKVSQDYDLALLKVDKYLTPSLSLGNSRLLRQGDKVFAVGSPLGLRDSVTSGIITGIKKEFLVTDAQILPGNSGGPLVNEAGEVIGVNTAKYSQNVLSDGFGFSIPVSTLREEFSSYLD